MKTKHLLATLFFSYLVASGPIASAQQMVSFCPQTLCGMMNGSYYYFCEVCKTPPCPGTYVTTDASYDTGGHCEGCGTPSCNERIPFLLKRKSGEAAEHDMDHVQCKINNYDNVPDVDYSDAHKFKRIDGRITFSELTLSVDINDTAGTPKTHLFRCFDVDLSACPAFTDVADLKPLRIGRRVKDGATPVGAPMQATRVSGKHHCHRLQVGERYFDVTSQHDIN